VITLSLTNLKTGERSGVEYYLDRVEHLPPTPTLLVKLIGLFSQPDHDVDEVVGLMAHDPALTMEVLRRCNSSFFGSDAVVTDINEAVFRLGFYEVYRISVALFGLQAVSAAKLTTSIEIEKLWRHSAYTAIAGGALGRELHESEGTAFTAGLLHDVGKIVLATAEGHKYAELLRQHGFSGNGLYDAEKLAFGINHGEVGAKLLERWGVPDEVSVPVLCHHQLHWSDPHAGTAAIVNLANLMAHFIEDNSDDKPCELPAAVPAMESLGLKAQDLPRLMNVARSDVKRLHSFLVGQAPH